MSNYKILSVEIDGQIYDLRETQDTLETNQKVIQTKVCTKCSQLKSVDQFSKNSKNPKDGLQDWCRECKRKYNRRYMKNYQRRKRKGVVSEPQLVKPDIPIVDASDPEALPVTPMQLESTVITDPEKQKRFRWGYQKG